MLSVKTTNPLAYHFIDIIGILAMLYCLFANFWILLAAFAVCGFIMKGGTHGSRGGAGFGIIIVVCLLYDPLLFLVTLTAMCLWLIYGPEYRRQFDAEDGLGVSK